MQGKITTLDESKSYGYITILVGKAERERRVFFEANQLDGNENLAVNTTVEVTGVTKGEGSGSYVLESFKVISPDTQG